MQHTVILITVYYLYVPTCFSKLFYIPIIRGFAKLKIFPKNETTMAVDGCVQVSLGNCFGK